MKYFIGNNENDFAVVEKSWNQTVKNSVYVHVFHKCMLSIMSSSPELRGARITPNAKEQSHSLTILNKYFMISTLKTPREILQHKFSEA